MVGGGIAGLTAAQIVGSGGGGRITREDVTNYVETQRIGQSVGGQSLARRRRRKRLALGRVDVGEGVRHVAHARGLVGAREGPPEQAFERADDLEEARAAAAAHVVGAPGDAGRVAAPLQRRIWEEVDAFIAIARRHPDAVLVLAGNDEQNLLPGLRAQIAERGLTGRFIAPGMVTGERKLDLLAHDFWIGRLDARNFPRCFRDDAGDCGKSVNAERGKRFQVRLRAGASATVRAGNGEGDGDIRCSTFDV